MAKKNCRWVLSPNTAERHGKYCEGPVTFKMVLDDDGNKVRKYFAFCADHQKRAAELEQKRRDEDMDIDFV